MRNELGRRLAFLERAPRFSCFSPDRASMPLFFSLRNHHNSGAFSDYNHLQLSGCIRRDTALDADDPTQVQAKRE